jgi:hypothetical protein
MKTLLEEWRKHRPGMVSDGIVDEETYAGSEVKILYILKEVHDDSGKGKWDLRDFLKDGAPGHGQTWNNVARWQYGIENIDREVSWEMADKNLTDKRDIFRRIAAINLKKEAGTGVAHPEEIRKYAQQDRELLQRQIELCRPDVIVCCGTGDVVKELQLAGDFKVWRTSITGVEYAVVENQIIFNFCHPNARVDAKEKFFLLTETYKRVKKSINLKTN